MWEWLAGGAAAGWPLGLVLSVLVKGTALVAAAAAARCRLRRRAAAWGHLIWGLSFAGLMLPFVAR